MSCPSDVFVGKWKMVHSDKYDDFLKALGVSWMNRKSATSSSPSLEISVNKATGTWQMKIESAFSTVLVVFKLDEEFEDQRPGDGAKAMTTISLEHDKLVQKSTGTVPYTITREVAHDVLKATMKAGDATGIRLYQRVIKA